MVSGGCIISGAQLRRSLLFSSVRVNSYAQTCDAVVLPEVQIGRSARLNKVVIDRGVRIPENLVVGEDAELDAKRFYRSDGGVVLISAEMLAAGRELAAATGLEGMVGGQYVDVAASAPAGAETVEGAGRHLFPAFVDPHVHLRTPGQEHKEDIDTGTRAATSLARHFVKGDLQFRATRSLRLRPF